MVHESSADELLARAAEAIGRRRIPRATYRWQFNRGFAFEDARRLVPYLRDLGISDCYASPILRARAGSAHGYDLINHQQLNHELGSEEDFHRFTDALREAGLGLVLDFVPNHMGIGDPANTWWLDVLENGPGSRYARYFDIDWRPLKTELRDKVLLPILGDQYGIVLDNGELQIRYEEGAFWLTYWEHKFPIAPRSYLHLLRAARDAIRPDEGDESECVIELMSIMTSLENLPEMSERDPERVAIRQREKEVAKRRISQLRDSCPEFAAALDNAVAGMNGRRGDPRSFDTLDRLLNEQAYRLAYWRVAAEEINYRRFFDINDLVAIRMEDPEVFEETHRLTLRLVREGRVTGLRIDHPDGLWDPAGYFHRLQERTFVERARGLIEAAAADLGADADELAAAFAERLRAARVDRGSPLWRTIYVVAEKILGKGEPLPDTWAVDGTTGYEFANAVNGIFVDAASRKLFDAIYFDFIDQRIHPRNLLNSSKKMIMLVSLASEINLLSFQLNRISEKNRRSRDFTVNSLTFALREVIAALPVYRTYSVMGRGSVDERDQEYIRSAVAEAKRRNPRTAAAIFDFIEEILLLRRPDHISDEDWDEARQFVMKFQQTTGPVMAKGLEDTAFYIFNRLVSLNEVGGEPDQFGLLVEELHRQNEDRRERWPHSMLSTSTHDTKRSEDVRARIDVLSELPVEWRESLGRWGEINRRHKLPVDGQAAPDRNEEYLLYQTLLGAWPLEPLDDAACGTFVRRIQDYMLKAIKEAKVNTSWVNPNQAWDQAVQAFVGRILDRREENLFLTDLADLRRKVAFFGMFNALSQVLIKLTAPGVPDIYQGNELWDFSLVDPDNRRPVDYDRRRRLLAELRGLIDRADGRLPAHARGLVDRAPDGRVKLFLTHRALTFRRDRPDLFATGDYRPLDTGGSRAAHLFAFARTRGQEAAITVAPRLVVGLARGREVPPIGEEVWQDTWIALPENVTERGLRNVLTGEAVDSTWHDGFTVVPAAAALAHFPVALLATGPTRS
ncbi:MAG TPA: malto-oligosyltrehalose synthase [Dehalococcoidia bacterium]|nr:malto-oligosyltrehalose synthase [Dehalococcoidia bacterium]